MNGDGQEGPAEGLLEPDPAAAGRAGGAAGRRRDARPRRQPRRLRHLQGDAHASTTRTWPPRPSRSAPTPSSSR
ncbi:MAG: hypothetical protein M0C28_41895 [Candidatus Moduliflexus flocculans]|nr:hypothetical protein [Candidatus Moduliflexus flocculans]